MIGTTEIVVIAVVVLILFGSAAIPRFARAIGRARREFDEGLREGSRAAPAQAAAPQPPPAVEEPPPLKPVAKARPAARQPRSRAPGKARSPSRRTSSARRRRAKA